MTSVRIMLMCAVAVSACEPEREPPSEDVRTGIYALTMSSVSNTCTPAPFTGRHGHVGVQVAAARLNLPVPRGDAFAGQSNFNLESTHNFRHHVWVGVGCIGGIGAERLDSLELVRAKGGKIEASYYQEWSGRDGCSEWPADMPVDCASERFLEYQLVTPCELPCAIAEAPRFGEPAELRCQCP